MMYFLQFVVSKISARIWHIGGWKQSREKSKEEFSETPVITSLGGVTWGDVGVDF